MQANTLGYVRIPRGSQMVELPIVLWLLLVCGVLPLVVMAVMTVRTTFIATVAKEAAHAAAKASTFEQSEPGHPSATELAQTTARTTASKFPGLTITKVTTSMIITDADKPSAPSDVRTTKLRPSEIIDTSKYVYSVQVDVSGQVEPLLRFSLPLFGDIPGFNKPMPMHVTGVEMFENAEGLKE